MTTCGGGFSLVPDGRDGRREVCNGDSAGDDVLEGHVSLDCIVWTGSTSMGMCRTWVGGHIVQFLAGTVSLSPHRRW